MGKTAREIDCGPANDRDLGTVVRLAPKSLRDKDGLELVRAAAWLDVAKDEWSWQGFSEWGKGSAERKKVLETIACGFQRPKLKYPSLVEDLVAWLNYLHPAADLLSFLLDATETSFALVPESEIRTLAELPQETRIYFHGQDPDWRNIDALRLWRDRLGIEARRRRESLTRQQVARWWQLLRWQDEPFARAVRERPDFSVRLSRPTTTASPPGPTSWIICSGRAGTRNMEARASILCQR